VQIRSLCKNLAQGCQEREEERKRERERERERERKNASSWEANETPVKGGWTRVALGRARRKKNPDDY